MVVMKNGKDKFFDLPKTSFILNVAKLPHICPIKVLISYYCFISDLLLRLGHHTNFSICKGIVYPGCPNVSSFL